MRILQVCAEIFPLLKTGGLADVAGALPPALGALGADVLDYAGQCLGPFSRLTDIDIPLHAHVASSGWFSLPRPAASQMRSLRERSTFG